MQARARRCSMHLSSFAALHIPLLREFLCASLCGVSQFLTFCIPLGQFKSNTNVKHRRQRHISKDKRHPQTMGSDVCWLCRDRMAPSSGRPSQDSAHSWSFDHHPHSTWHHNSESIVSLLPSATEILFALGLGSR